MNPVPSWAAGDRRRLLIGGIAGAVLLLLLCGGVGVYALTRPKSEATPTAQRLGAGTPTIAANATVSGGASPVAASVLWEEASRAPIVAASWQDPTAPRRIEITARVATRDRAGFSPEGAPEQLTE